MEVMLQSFQTSEIGRSGRLLIPAALPPLLLGQGAGWVPEVARLVRNQTQAIQPVESHCTV